MTPSTAGWLNMQLYGPVPMDIVHLAVVGALALSFSAVFVALPLGRIGRAGLAGRELIWTVVYFSALGMGFIIIELVLMQQFIRLVGVPAYAFSAVVFGLLAGAGRGVDGRTARHRPAVEFSVRRCGGGGADDARPS